MSYAFLPIGCSAVTGDNAIVIVDTASSAKIDRLDNAGVMYPDKALAGAEELHYREFRKGVSGQIYMLTKPPSLSIGAPACYIWKDPDWKPQGATYGGGGSGIQAGPIPQPGIPSPTPPPLYVPPAGTPATQVAPPLDIGNWKLTTQPLYAQANVLSLVTFNDVKHLITPSEMVYAADAVAFNPFRLPEAKATYWYSQSVHAFFAVGKAGPGASTEFYIYTLPEIPSVEPPPIDPPPLMKDDFEDESWLKQWWWLLVVAGAAGAGSIYYMRKK